MNDLAKRLRGNWSLTDFPTPTECADELDALAARLAEAERDAERYRWLRAEHDRVDPCIRASAKYKLDRDGTEWVNIHDLDAAIDAARAADSAKDDLKVSAGTSNEADELREAIVAAYISGAEAAHLYYEPMKNPDFSEAAHDYAVTVSAPAAPGDGLPKFYSRTFCSQCGDSEERIRLRGCPEKCGRTADSADGAT